MQENVTNAQLLAAIAEIKGSMHGVTQLMETHQRENHRRIDDMRRELVSHIDRQQQQINGVGDIARRAELMATEAKAIADSAGGKGAKAGIAAGSLMSAGMELIKAVFKPL